MGERRVAILGLFNSGSTAVAGMLYRLGVNLGPPFWGGDSDPGNFYESYDLAWHLRRWWTELELTPCVTAEYRVKVLSAWSAYQETMRPGPIGAKHPLLSLSGEDLVAAWGVDARFVWAWRPLADSVAGLQRRGWYIGVEQSMQKKLWDALNAFAYSHPGVARFEWERVRSEPFVVARQLASIAGLEPHEQSLVAAAEFITQE